LLSISSIDDFIDPKPPSSIALGCSMNGSGITESDEDYLVEIEIFPVSV
jgi:hypothetical protein